MKTIKWKKDDKDVEKKITEIVTVLDAGGLVILPTETVYGMMADATNAKAIEKLARYKKRPLGKPFSVAVCDQDMANEYVELNDTARQIYRNFLPGPVTVVSLGKHKVAPGVESETGTLGVRIPDYPLVIEVVKRLGRPITATSANASYKRRPYQVADVFANISVKQKALIDLVVDAGLLPKREPSTVIDTLLDEPVVLRQGDVKFTSQNKVFCRSEADTRNTGKELWQKYAGYAGKRAIVFALSGLMGSGKTTFVKGVARAMGIDDEIVSPTFQLEIDYVPTRKTIKTGGLDIKLAHLDAWRLQGHEELEELGLEKQVTDKSIIVIEWAERVAEGIRKYNDEAVVVWVGIEYADDGRFITWGVEG